MYLALNNLQRLIYHKTQPTNQYTCRSILSACEEDFTNRTNISWFIRFLLLIAERSEKKKDKKKKKKRGDINKSMWKKKNQP